MLVVTVWSGWVQHDGQPVEEIRAGDVGLVLARWWRLAARWMWSALRGLFPMGVISQPRASALADVGSASPKYDEETGRQRGLAPRFGLDHWLQERCKTLPSAE